jgi:hypothetical protein
LSQISSPVLALGNEPPSSFDGPAFVDAVFSKVSNNWRHCLAVLDRDPSPKNWRLRQEKDNSPKNMSPEVTLERAIVNAAQAGGRKDWCNQITVAAGIIAGNRRAIDLVYQRGPAAFDLIELKIASNTPHSAAIEILEYGLIWLLSRRERERLGYAGKPLIEATDIGLSVLAPHAYYRNLDLSWLASGLDAGVRELGNRIDGVKMGFAFTEFPDAALCDLVDGRVRR